MKKRLWSALRSATFFCTILFAKADWGLLAGVKYNLVDGQKQAQVTGRIIF